MNFLERILSQKKIEIEEAKKEMSFADLKSLVRPVHPGNDFKNAISRRNDESVRIIAEIKRASPSRGDIAENVDPVKLAQDYKNAGASAVSILTEKDFFKGSTLDLQKVRKDIPDIPLLRKDFIIDEYQIYESVRIGADAILLIVAALSENLLRDFLSAAKELQLGSLVEVHTEKELDIALSAGAEIVGVNNRNLVNFEVSSVISEQLAKKIPDGIVTISESGIDDVSGLQAAFESGYHAVLIGEHFMRAKDRLAEVRRFVSYRKDEAEDKVFGLESKNF